MTIYDDKTTGVIASEGRLILPLCEEYDDVMFRASFIVVSNLKCEGKITALFDLVALGDVEADEIDIKGRFICLGDCRVNGSVLVQNEIWANGLIAASIESRDRITAQKIDCDTIIADGSIVIGKILAVKEIARTDNIILCGETAYGAGKVAASTVITGEPIDLDDGVDAVVSPALYVPVATLPQLAKTTAATEESTCPDENYAPQMDLMGYLEHLIAKSFDSVGKAKLKRWKNVLSELESIKQSEISDYSDISVIIWLAEIVLSGDFEEWEEVYDLYYSFESHFKALISSSRDAILCEIDCYEKWLEGLLILRRYGAKLDRDIYNFLFETVVSKLGLKAKFVSDRLHEKGWEAYGK